MNYIRNDIKFIIIFIIIGFLIGPKIFAKQKDASVSNNVPIVVEKMSTTTSIKENPFENIKITGKSAYVWDIANQKVLYSKDSETKRPLASITKIMTAVVALEEAKRTELIKINNTDLETEGDNGLREGEKISLKDLLTLTLVASSNDGASAIAASVGSSLDDNQSNRRDGIDLFIFKMNQKASSLQLNSLYFNSPTGLDVGNTPGGVGSARDIARLFEYTLKNHSDLLQYTSLPKISVLSEQKIIHKATNTNEIASITPGIIGGKTGFTDLAGGNLAMVVDIGIQHPVVIVVLGSTKEARFTDVKNLLNATKKL
jgi:D-alanyl-D-alanine carboxypeptidase (penicillin-binding protein 5/6)